MAHSPSSETGSRTGRPAWKALEKRIVLERESAGEPTLDHNSSTNALIRRYRRFKKKHD